MRSTMTMIAVAVGERATINKAQRKSYEGNMERKGNVTLENTHRN